MNTIRYISESLNRIEIESVKSKKRYSLIFEILKGWQCTCPDAIYRKNKNCKHIRAFMAGEISTPPESIKIDEFA